MMDQQAERGLRCYNLFQYPEADRKKSCPELPATRERIRLFNEEVKWECTEGNLDTENAGAS